MGLFRKNVTPRTAAPPAELEWLQNWGLEQDGTVKPLCNMYYAYVLRLSGVPTTNHNLAQVHMRLFVNFKDNIAHQFFDHFGDEAKRFDFVQRFEGVDLRDWTARPLLYEEMLDNAIHYLIAWQSATKKDILHFLSYAGPSMIGANWMTGTELPPFAP